MQNLYEFERVVCDDWGLVDKNSKWSLYLLSAFDWSCRISHVPHICINFIGVSLHIYIKISNSVLCCSGALYLSIAHCKSNQKFLLARFTVQRWFIVRFSPCAELYLT